MWAPTEPIYRTATPAASRAWRDRHARYRLVGSTCLKCGRDDFPGRSVCPSCRSRDHSARVFSRRGRIVAFVVDHTPLMGHSAAAERLLAMVELEGGVHVTAEVVDTPIDDIREGTEVEMITRKWRREATGLYQYGYKFRVRGDGR